MFYESDLSSSIKIPSFQSSQADTSKMCKKQTIYFKNVDWHSLHYKVQNFVQYG